MKKTTSRSIDVDKAHYLYEKLQHCINSGYKELSLEYLDKLLDVLTGEEKGEVIPW